MLPEIVWNMPHLGTYNLHGSLLPEYRGAAPINHAIINGETTTGVTSFKLKHEIDTGDILIKRSIDITEDDDAGSLHDKMMILGANVILDTVKMLESGHVHYMVQNDAEATPAPKIFHETCKINFDQPVKKVYDFIRGLSPYPAAWCHADGKEMKVLKSSFEITSDDTNQPGFILTDQKKILKIKCKDGYIQLLTIKPEGKKVMEVHEFLNGHKVFNIS